MSWARAVELVRRGRRFLVTGHRRPDADALGSALGLAVILRALGKEAVVFVSESLADPVRFMTGSEHIVDTLPQDARFDATWVMDTPAADLFPPGFPEPPVSGPVVIVDHHVAYDDCGDVVVRDTSACATGEVVYRLMKELGLMEVPRDAAEPLYAALAADTGGFRYPGTSAATLRLGAELVDAGADACRAAHHLFEDWPWARLRLLGLVLDKVESHLDGRVTTLRVTREMLAQAGASEDMVEGLVNYGRMVRGVELTALAWEQRPAGDAADRPRTKVSLRSSGEVDVSRIAVQLGGGGHRGAAGAELTASVDEALARVRHEATRQLQG